LAMVALSLRSARQTVVDFPVTLNSSCTDAVITVRSSIAEALEVIIDDTQNFTNKQYHESVNITRILISKTMNLTTELFALMLKQVNPYVYCTVNAGLDMTSSLEQDLFQGLIDHPTINCDDHDLCDNAVVNAIINSLNDLIGDVTTVTESWPVVPRDLTDTLDDALDDAGFSTYINELENFPAPTNILNLNSTQIVTDAMANVSLFVEVVQTCEEISISLVEVTHKTSQVIYYIEIALWLSIALLVVGIFVSSIVKQFPTAFSKWVAGQWDSVVNSVEHAHRNLETKGETSRPMYYLLWLMKYVNFRMALLSTCYGALGLLMIYNLSNFTDETKTSVNYWVETGLGPSMVKIQLQIQDGINDVVQNIQNQMNDDLHAFSQAQLDQINAVLGDIMDVKQGLEDTLSSTESSISGTPVVGGFLSSALTCMLPTSTLTMIDESVGIVLEFVTAAFNFEVQLPTYTFPYMAGTATSASHTAVNAVVSALQSEIRQYQVIFIFLCIAVGILVFQGLVFLSFKKIIEKVVNRG